MALTQTATNDVETNLAGLRLVPVSFYNASGTLTTIGSTIGWTVTKPSTGIYVVTFGTPFKGAVVTASIDASNWNFGGGMPNAAALISAVDVAAQTVTFAVGSVASPIVSANLASGLGITALIALDTSSGNVNG